MAAVQERGSARVTFDDGAASVVDLALPVLESVHARATMFAIGGNIGRPGYCDAYQIREWFGAGNSVGTHGWSHRSLTLMPLPDAIVEMSRSKEVLEDIVQAPMTSLSFPNGQSSAAVRDAAHALGYTELYGSWPDYGKDRLGIGCRFAVLRSTSDQVLNDILSGNGIRHFRKQRAAARVRSVVGERAYRRLRSLVASRVG